MPCRIPFYLVAAFHFQEEIRCYNGWVADSAEALCICLNRFAYPWRYADMIPRYSRPVPQLYALSNKVIDILFDKYSLLFGDLNRPWLTPESLQIFANAVFAKGAALDNCWEFIDGICRPKRNQWMVYNGHKRVHTLKFLSVVAPNVLIANLFGRVEGRRHDSGLLAMSGLLNQLKEKTFAPKGNPLSIYGDPAYPHRLHLQCPFDWRLQLTPEEQAFKQSMSRVRASV